MDGQLSSAHRSSCRLLDLVDSDWLVDSLSDDDLHLSEADLAPPVEEVDEQCAVVQDREGASWSLSVPAHSTQGAIGSAATSAAGAGLAIGRGAGLTGITYALGASLSHSLAFGVGGGSTSHLAVASAMASSAAGGSAASAVESADGLRWTDLALGTLAATAAKQPNPQ